MKACQVLNDACFATPVQPSIHRNAVALVAHQVTHVHHEDQKLLHEAALVAIVRGLALYADALQLAYETEVGPAGCANPISDGWKDVAEGLMQLLNGELGRLDGQCMSRLVHDLAEVAGVELDR